MAKLKDFWIRMAERHHRLLAACAALALIGLVMIQAYLVKIDLDVQQRKFENEIPDVLLEMHHGIENSESISGGLIRVFTDYEKGSVPPESITQPLSQKIHQVMDSVLLAFGMSSLKYDFVFYQRYKDEIVLSSAKGQVALEDYQQYAERAGWRVREAMGEGMYRFGVHFHNKYWYWLQQTAWLLTLSVILIGLVLGSFFITILALQKLQKTLQMKNDFINNFAHEIKTPLFASSVIFKVLQKHLQAQNFQRLQEPLQLLAEENQQLKGKVEKVLDVNVLDEGKAGLVSEKVDMHEIISSILPLYQYLVNEQKGTIHCTLDAPFSSLKGDIHHLRHVIENLLDNALKYSEGVPQIVMRTSGDKKKLHLTIQDQGMGIATEDQIFIFDKFFRVSQGNTHNVKGFGLGLSYVKRITELHGGQIHVKSQAGKGTTFTLTFPVLSSISASHAYSS